MHNQSAFLPIAALMFLTGIGIPILATWNAGLGLQLGSTSAATAVLFVVGAVLSVLIMFIAGGVPSASSFNMERPHAYFAVVFMIFYILSITWAAPRIGLGNAIFFVLLGQLVAAALIDHFGLWGAIRTEITGKRVLGIAVMVLGVYLARKPV